MRRSLKLGELLSIIPGRKTTKLNYSPKDTPGRGEGSRVQEVLMSSTIFPASGPHTCWLGGLELGCAEVPGGLWYAMERQMLY